MSLPRAEATVCVYCQEHDADTEDHVIPEGFFDRPPEAGYIKVPACYSCNNSHSRDEEYFLVVVLAEATVESEPANRVLDRIGTDHQSGRRKRIGLARALLEKLRPMDVYSPGGIYLGSGKGVQLDTERMTRVLRKMVRGLYFHHFGFALPPSASVYVEIKPEPDHLRWPPIAAALAAVAIVIPGIFSFRVWTLAGQPKCRSSVAP